MSPISFAESRDILSPISLVIEAACAWGYREIGPCCCGWSCWVPESPEKKRPKKGEGRPQIWLDGRSATFVRPTGDVEVGLDGVRIRGLLGRADEVVFESLMADPDSAWSEAWEAWQTELARVRRARRTW